MAKGATFRNIAVSHRTGVDPTFRADPGELEGAGVELHATTSDAYFARLAADVTFDLIFLDGLHTAEQTYRDLCASLAHAHPRTVILLDDTWPSDVYSAMPDQADAIKFRRHGGGDGANWHGDVYKVVAMIHDFHDVLDFATIVGQGNPQTLVWTGPHESRTRRFSGLATIGSLTYFDLLRDPSFLQPMSEADALSRCLGSLAPSLPQSR